MTEHWIDWSSDARDRFTRVISDLRELSLLPDTTSADDISSLVSDMLDRRDQIATKTWDSKASEIPVQDGKTALRQVSEVLSAADQAVIDELVSRIPAKSVHERMNSAAYLAAEIDAATAEAATLDSHRSGGPASQQDATDTELLGDPADYAGIDPIEDVAIPPRVVWTEADRKIALDEAASTYGVAPGEWYSVEWPPTDATLWTPGYLVTSEWKPCDEHTDDPDSDEALECVQCEDSVTTDIEEMAVWKFTTRLTHHRIGFDSNGSLVVERSTEDIDPSFEVREITQDPRLVRIGPPHGHR
ncbi:hypothetical protein [Gordonia hongkongensis]|uniref:hypothetical protein n=1 Tax=Gordonia hongkongensis TaxID=1701090 RepID=UPI001FF9C4F0|nr:hypothetical protein [Gordonia hongkongensis]UPG69876.1 hypothetical protein MVF96_08890 [Gordonia hongkongensis]